jgi:hypothetical protein
MTATYRQAISIGLKKSVNETLRDAYRFYGQENVNGLLRAYSL